MGKALYQRDMRQRIQEMGFAIAGLRQKLADGIDARLKVDLSAQLAELEMRRDQMAHKLAELDRQPDSRWNDLKAEFDEEWNILVQDFEERLGHLA